MSVAKLRPTIHHRVGELERRADKHDAMADQVHEMYEVFDLTRKVFRGLNRASVKVSAICLGSLGALATMLTIWEKARALWH